MVAHLNAQPLGQLARGTGGRSVALSGALSLAVERLQFPLVHHREDRFGGRLLGGWLPRPWHEGCGDFVQ